MVLVWFLNYTAGAVSRLYPHRLLEGWHLTGNSLPLFPGCILIMALLPWVFHLWYHTLQSGVPQSPTQGSDKTTGGSEAEEHDLVLCMGLLWGLLMKGLGKNEDHYDTVNTTRALL